MTPLVLNHPLYSKTVTNLERTVVRDKLIRLFQYFSRFLSFYAFRKGYSPQVVAQLKALVSALSLARKAFRIGKPLAAFRAIAQELSNHTSPLVKHFTNLGRNVGSSVFLTLDALAFLHLSGAYKFSPARFRFIQDNANRFWFLSIVSNIVDAGYATYVESLRIKALSQDEKASEDEIKRATADRRKQTRVLVWNLLDALIPLTSLQILPANEGLVGIAGTITSYMGLRDSW